MAAKIVFLDQQQLWQPELMPALKHLDHGTKVMLQARNRFDPGIRSIYTRGAVNTLPFRNNILQHLPLALPEHDHDPGQFSDVTDQRCLELWQRRSDRPWVVSWSGGIDSTVILVAMLRNLSLRDRSRIRVACNRCSIWESPRFYQDFVVPNFTVIDSSDLYTTAEDLGCYVLDGEPGDQLYAGGMSQAMVCDDPALLERDLYAHQDQLINYIANYRRSASIDPVGHDFAQWYVDLVMRDSEANSVRLRTFHDFFWWNFFNLSWISSKFRAMALGRWGQNGSARFYLEHVVHWYDSTQYQQWSLSHNRAGEKYGDTVGDYKRASKNYVTDHTKDQHWARFKTKVYSDSLQMPAARPWFCMLDDFTLLSLDRDLDKILALLPDHINSIS